MTREQKAVIKAAMLFAKCWDIQWIPRGNRGRIARLVRACNRLAALSRRGKR